MPLGTPIPLRVELTDEELAEADALLTAVIGHWERLGNISIDGLRDGYLRRDGRLAFENGDLKLSNAPGWGIEIDPEWIALSQYRVSYNEASS